MHFPQDNCWRRTCNDNTLHFTPVEQQIRIYMWWTSHWTLLTRNLWPPNLSFIPLSTATPTVFIIIGPGLAAYKCFRTFQPDLWSFRAFHSITEDQYLVDTSCMFLVRNYDWLLPGMKNWHNRVLNVLNFTWDCGVNTAQWDLSSFRWTLVLATFDVICTTRTALLAAGHNKSNLLPALPGSLTVLYLPGGHSGLRKPSCNHRHDERVHKTDKQCFQAFVQWTMQELICT